MKILMVSKAVIVGAYQRKLEELAALPDMHLTVLAPASWHEPNVGRTELERAYTHGYDLEVVPMRFNGQHHLHYYPTLRRHIARLKPDLLHADDESFNLATAHAIYWATRAGVPSVFYNWANIYRNYPPPFAQFERYTFRHAVAGIAGNQEARDILRRRGYTKPVAVIPQFGVDPQMFQKMPPAPDILSLDKKFTVGYAGRLLERKGLATLVAAVAKLHHAGKAVRLVFIGNGDMRQTLEAQVRAAGIDAQFLSVVPSVEMPRYLNALDVLVLPSLTLPSWKEQFGRVLAEAMACEVPVIGSDSGEIPHVIGGAGLVFPEGDADTLAVRLTQLIDSPDLRADFSKKGRARALALYTQESVAKHHYDVYQAALGQSPHYGVDIDMPSSPAPLSQTGEGSRIRL